MTSKKNVVRVTILGDEYSIRSDQSPERTRAVAEHVDQVIKDTMRAGNIVEAQKGAILAALSITDAETPLSPPYGEIISLTQLRDDFPAR
jgi:cell division protein ZapA (FtsZ GTPase activity inhibitor)